MHLKKDLFYFGKGCEKKVRVLHKYDRKVKRNEKDNKFYIDNDYAAHLHQYFSYGSRYSE